MSLVFPTSYNPTLCRWDGRLSLGRWIELQIDNHRFVMVLLVYLCLTHSSWFLNLYLICDINVYKIFLVGWKNRDGNWNFIEYPINFQHRHWHFSRNIEKYFLCFIKISLPFSLVFFAQFDLFRFSLYNNCIYYNY